LVLARGLSEQVELQGATGSDHGKGWSTRSRSTRDRMGFERFPDIALKSGIYLRPMSKKEAIVAMAETLMAFYEKQDQPYRHAALAQFLLKYSPNDICALLNLFAATQEIRRQEFVKKYPIANDTPINERPRLLMLNDQLESIYDRAYGLGWRPLEISAKTGYGANAKFQN
ncbi:hypothetical protein, partial [Acidovorax sp. SUPP1855]|uniref:hypothetical protein n=1 Tax=Acidovorax sp. SUPP1855 TaxID=431774 RepID=UPI0024E06650